MRMGRITNVYDVEPVVDTASSEAERLAAALVGSVPVEVASIDTPYGPLRIVADDTVPEDTVEFRHPDGRIDRLVNVGR